MFVYRIYVHDDEQFAQSSVYALTHELANSVADYLRAKGTPVIVRRELLDVVN